jgi:hypothetical protein
VIKQFAKCRGVKSVPDGSTWYSIPIRDLLAPFMKRNYDQYLVRRSDESIASSCFVADLMTTPEAREGRCGTSLPTLTCNSRIASLTKSEFLTPNVLDFLHGWPTLDDVGHDVDDPAKYRYENYRACMPSGVGSLSYNSYAHVAGNAQHLATQFAWTVYIMLNVVRRDSNLSPWLRKPDSDNDDCEDPDTLAYVEPEDELRNQRTNSKTIPRRRWGRNQLAPHHSTSESSDISIASTSSASALS